MNIYDLVRDDSDEFGYDEMYSCVVIAEDERHAREYAKHHAGVEGPDKWISSMVNVRSIGVAHEGAELELVCRNYHAG